jgi:hypothetical protein
MNTYTEPSADDVAKIVESLAAKGIEVINNG